MFTKNICKKEIPPLKTQRLTLRPITEGDFDAIHSYMSVGENKAFMVFDPNTEAETMMFIKNAIENEAIIEFALISQAGGEFIGNVGLEICSDEPCRIGEIGWIIHRKYWNNGYASEAARRIAEFAFNDLHIDKLIARCDSENISSINVMKKLGMQLETKLAHSRKGNCMLDYAMRDECIYATYTMEKSSSQLT